MEKTVITIGESDCVNIPSGEVWMPEVELMELSGMIVPTLQAAIKAIYRKEILCHATPRRFEVVTSVS